MAGPPDCRRPTPLTGVPASATPTGTSCKLKKSLEGHLGFVSWAQAWARMTMGMSQLWRPSEAKRQSTQASAKVWHAGPETALAGQVGTELPEMSTTKDAPLLDYAALAFSARVYTQRLHDDSLALNGAHFKRLSTLALTSCSFYTTLHCKLGA